MRRREFLASVPLIGLVSRAEYGDGEPISRSKRLAEEAFEISISQWSYHRAIFGDSRSDYAWFIKALHESPDDVLRGELDPRDIVFKAQELGVSAVDLVNVLFFGHADDEPWLREFESRAEQARVSFEVLMLDEAGNLAASDSAERAAAIESHLEWMRCAQRLSCRSVRVNAYGDGSYLEQLKNCAGSLRQLAREGEAMGLEILVENHGHPSSNGAWLAMLMEQTQHPNVGVLADFDNFFMGGWGHSPQRRYDTQQGMLDLGPYIRALSAKSYEFDAQGLEPSVDFEMCLRIALEHGFRGFASAEFEGEHLSEDEGTAKTVALLRHFRDALGSDL